MEFMNTIVLMSMYILCSTILFIGGFVAVLWLITGCVDNLYWWLKRLQCKLKIK